MQLADLSELVGSSTKLDGRVSLDVGTVLVVLKDGLPVKVVEPGRGYRRGHRLPVFGEVQGIPLSTAEHVVRVEITNVATNDDYTLPRLDLQISLKLNPTGAYGPLLKYVQRNGANFNTALQPRVWNAVDQFVRTELSRVTHEQAYGRNFASLLPRGQELLEGLFLIDEVLAGEAQWDPLYVGLRRSRAATIAKLNEIQQTMVVTVHEQKAALETMPGQQVIETAQLQHELQLAQVEAAASGVPLAAIRSPEIFNAALAAQVELTKALIENHRAAASPLVRDTLNSFGQAFNPGPVRPLQSTINGAEALTTPRLARDERLEGVWRDRGLDDVVLGAGVAQRGRYAAVLLVVSNPAVITAVVEKLTAQLSDVLDATVTLHVSAHDPDLALLVGSYLANRVEAFADVAQRCSLSVDDGRLQVRVPVTANQWQRVRREVTDPSRLVLEPLARILPYDVVDIVPAQAA